MSLRKIDVGGKVVVLIIGLLFEFGEFVVMYVCVFMFLILIER